MKDIQYAGIVLVLFMAIVGMRLRFPAALNLLSMLSRPGATIVLLGVVALIFHKGLPITALITAVIVVFLLQTIWKWWPNSDEKRLFLDVGRDLSRFDESNSIDLQFANGTATHNTPYLLEPPVGFNELLVFPPSSETLNQMCGN
jgi:hypothetical protein